MAGAQCASFSFLSPTIKLNTRKTKPLFLACLPTPRKLTKRKNHLRLKILKPYSPPTDPVLPETHSENPIIPILSPETTHDEFQSSQIGDNRAEIAEEDLKVENFRVSESSGGDIGGVGKFSARSVLKYGVYLIGVFVFQTICAVWLFGNTNTDERDGNSKSSGPDKGKILLNGNGKILSTKFGFEKSKVGFLDESQLEKKIEEIKAMAREVRKSEKKEVKEDSRGEDIIGIEKEIGQKLLKLQKKLNSSRERPPKVHVNYVGKSEKDEDEVSENVSGAKEGNETLIFKKKLKFRSPSVEPRKSPKGFGDSGEHNVPKRDRISSIDKIVVNGSGGIDRGVGTSKPGIPTNGVSNPGRSSAEETYSGKSSESRMKNDKHFLIENQKNRTENGEHHLFSKNRSPRSRKNKLVADNVRHEQSNAETDLWWLNLPYVLAVFMRRGSDPEGVGGLYTLKITSQSQNQEASYTVAFEDRGDANNFCFLLEVFFEELGDFMADIVPLSARELHEAVNSKRTKAIVVRKGQLGLYAGQPFADVEMALKNLAKENQSAS